MSKLKDWKTEKMENGFQKQKELDALSIAKVICMLLVVVGHAAVVYTGAIWGGIKAAQQCVPLGIFNSFVATFHTQTFAFASGYLFYMLRYEKGKYRSKTDIIKRAKRLLIPYLCFSVLWAIPFAFLCEKLTVYQVIKNYVLGISPAQLWFLLMLFMVFVLFFVIGDFCVKRNPVIITLGFFIVFYMVVILARFLPIGIFQIKTVFKYALYYWAGMMLRKNRKVLISSKTVPVIIIVEAVLFCIYYMVEADYLRAIIEPFLSLAGIAMIFGIVSLFPTQKIIKSRVFTFLEKHSMGVYLVHQQVMYITLGFSNKFNISPYIIFVFNFVAVLLISVILVMLLRKTKMGRIALGEV